jgi:iron complex outermembrane receptor protein
MINSPACLPLRLILTVLLAVTFGAHAQQPTEQLEEITVTAQKVTESLQKTPIAVSVLSNDELKDLGITNAHDLDSYAPNVKVTESSAGLKFFIRGVGIDVFGVGNDSGVAFHRDGVYNPDTRSQIASFFDIDRIEVLRGPQGTLYGRNATGGVVNVITAQPTDELAGYADLTYGNYNQADFEGAISGPIIQDEVNGRLAAMIRTHDGFGTNIGTGDKIDNQNEKAVRGTLVVKFTPDLDLHLSGQYFLKDDRSGGFHYFAVANPAIPLTGLTLGGFLNTNIRDIASEIDPRRYLETYDGAATLNWKLNEQWTIKSISGYGKTNSYLVSDLDLTTAKDAQFFQTVKSEVYSEEVQSIWTGADSRAILSAYYFHETLLQAQPSLLFPRWLPGDL